MGAWISRQRRLYREGKLSQNEINFLENTHITWDLKKDNESIWAEKYKKLLAVKQQYGHFDISHKNNPIMRWKGYLRNAYRKGTLSAKRIKLLEKIGFKWVPKDTRWQNKYEAAEI